MSDDAKNGPPIVTRRVRQRLKELGWYDGDPVAQDLQRRTGLGYATVNDLLAGRTNKPDADTLEVLADTLRVSVDWLLGRDQDFDQRAYDLGMQAADDDNVVKLEVIGMVVDGDVDPLVLKRTADLACGRSRDDAQVQAWLAALERGVEPPPLGPGGNGESDGDGPQGDPPRDGTND